MSKITKIHSKYQKYLKYLLILYPNIQTKPIYMLILCVLKYVIQIYLLFIILFIDFEKF